MPLLKDLIVVLPGIMGSELRKEDGELLWGMSWRMVWNRLRSGGFASLTLAHDDPEDDRVDNVVATGLMPSAHLIPGFWKIDFYTQAVDRIQAAFSNVCRGVATRDSILAGPILAHNAVGGTAPANLIEFPYDWRRDNRVAARHLSRLVDQQAGAIARATGNYPRAILVAHSMGGLIARYYLETLGGWEACRALYSYGTPYRGSPQAAHYLMNGYPAMPAYVGDVLRSFTSVYQLLPTYPVFLPDAPRSYRRVHEVAELPGIDQARAKAGRGFHQKILETASATLPKGCALIPFVGIGQPTMQEFRWDGAAYAPGLQVPRLEGVDPARADVYSGGDGTVPRISATPPEFGMVRIGHFVVENHSSLLVNAAVLDDLIQRLRESQIPDSDDPYTAAPGAADVDVGAADVDAGSSASLLELELELDDMYSPEESLKIRLRVARVVAGSPPSVAIQADGASGPPLTLPAVPTSDDAWEVTFPPLPSDLYRVEARATLADSGATLAVRDVFVIDEPATGAKP